MTTQTKFEPDSNESKTVTTKSLPVPLRAGHRGLVLGTVEEMWRFAKYLIASGMAPSHIQKPEQAIIAMQMGAEIGLAPMGSVQAIGVIKGKPSLFGDALLAVCRQHPAWDESGFKEHYTGTPMADDWTAHHQCRRKGGNNIVQSFSVAEAKAAKLWGSGSWATYPRRMLMWRARGFGLRDGFADALSGFISSEEAQDYPAPEVRATVVSSTAPEPSSSAGPRVKKRMQRAMKKKEEEEQFEPDSNEPLAVEPPPHIKKQYASLPPAVQKVVLAKHELANMDASPVWAVQEFVDSVSETLRDILDLDGDDDDDGDDSVIDADFEIEDEGDDDDDD